MSDVVTQIRAACAEVTGRARFVRLDPAAVAGYAAALPLGEPAPAHPGAHLEGGARTEVAAFWLTLDAVNFGSGWFPTLRKRPGASGYFTVAGGLRDRFAERGPWTADELAEIEPGELARVLGQDPGHELMALFARSLNDLGARLGERFAGSFTGPIEAASGSAVGLAELLSSWSCFADAASYQELKIPFLKRAQIAAADLHRAGAARFGDLGRLTMFADNLVPHVLRLDGILAFAEDLVARIDAGRLLEPGSPEEVEIRACALHAVELIARERPDSCPAEIDLALWERGQQPRYKAAPRHRCRCTAY